MKRLSTFGLILLSVLTHAIPANAQTANPPGTDSDADPDSVNQALADTAQSIALADVPAVLDLLASASGDNVAELSQLLIRRWAENDPAAASAWTAKWPDSPQYRAALVQVAIAWANSDLPAALDWLRSLPEGDSKRPASISLAYEASRTAPVTAVSLASELAQAIDRDDLLVHAVSQWVNADAAGAMAWTANVPDRNLQQQLLAAVAIALADQDGSAAATFTSDTLDEGEPQDRAAVSVVQRWAEQSPQAAATWVSEFPDTPLRESAAENLVALWSAQDANAASNWKLQLSYKPPQEASDDLGHTFKNDGYGGYNPPPAP